IVSAAGTGAKVAVTVVAVVSVTVHDPVPLHPPPLQPVNLEFAPGAAVSITGVPPIKLAEQVAPQVIPGGTLDTVPEPLPARTMVSGTATAIVNGKAVEVPPSGAGLNTVTCAVPGVRMSVARIVAWSSVVRRTVVGRFAPFQRTTELETKLLPFTFKTKPPVPAATMAGVRDPTEGSGVVPSPIST